MRFLKSVSVAFVFFVLLSCGGNPDEQTSFAPPHPSDQGFADVTSEYPTRKPGALLTTDESLQVHLWKDYDGFAGLEYSNQTGMWSANESAPPVPAIASFHERTVWPHAPDPSSAAGRQNLAVAGDGGFSDCGFEFPSLRRSDCVEVDPNCMVAPSPGILVEAEIHEFKWIHTPEDDVLGLPGQSSCEDRHELIVLRLFWRDSLTCCENHLVSDANYAYAIDPNSLQVVAASSESGDLWGKIPDKKPGECDLLCDLGRWDCVDSPMRADLSKEIVYSGCAELHLLEQGLVLQARGMSSSSTETALGKGCLIRDAILVKDLYRDTVVQTIDLPLFDGEVGYHDLVTRGNNYGPQ